MAPILTGIIAGCVAATVPGAQMRPFFKGLLLFLLVVVITWISNWLHGVPFAEQ